VSLKEASKFGKTSALSSLSNLQFFHKCHHGHHAESLFQRGLPCYIDTAIYFYRTPKIAGKLQNVWEKASRNTFLAFFLLREKHLLPWWQLALWWHCYLLLSYSSLRFSNRQNNLTWHDNALLLSSCRLPVDLNSCDQISGYVALPTIIVRTWEVMPKIDAKDDA